MRDVRAVAAAVVASFAALGMEAIKSKGGITFAQDRPTAQF